MPDQKSIYILCQSQRFFARQKDDLHSVKLVFVPAQKFLGPVKGQGNSYPNLVLIYLFKDPRSIKTKERKSIEPVIFLFLVGNGPGSRLKFSYF